MLKTIYRFLDPGDRDLCAKALKLQKLNFEILIELFPYFSL